MKRISLALLIVILCALSGHAQNVGTGSYPFASFDRPGLDSVNLGNLNVRFTMPIVSKPGRKMPFNYGLQYEGLVWHPTYGVWTNDPSWGLSGVLNGNVITGYLTHNVDSLSCSSDPGDPYAYGYAYFTNSYVYHDPFGVAHAFNYSTTETWGDCSEYYSWPPQGYSTNGDGSSYDGSGYGLISEFQVRTPTGTVISPPSSATSQAYASITDPNGNLISTDGSGNFTDTTGTTALTVTRDSVGTATFTYPVTLQGNNATTANATLTVHNYTVRTNFQCPNLVDYGSNTVALADRLTLADGSFYQFSYEATPGASDGAVTGRLASVTLPTGGVISYSYSGGCNNSGINPDGSVAGLTRTTSDNTQGSSISGGTKTYTHNIVNSTASTTLMQDEKGNQSYFHFAISGDNNNAYETNREIYQGSMSGGNQLLDTFTCYNGATANCDGQTLTLPITSSSALTSYNHGSQELSVATYDGSGNLTNHSEIVGSTLIGNTVTDYNSLSEPVRIQSYDGSGNTLSQVTYGYDESSPVSTASVPQHYGVSGPHGNQTSTHTWTGSGYLDTSTAYYDTGMPISTMDVGGKTTQFSYDSAQAFITQTTLPTPSSGVGLSTSSGYDQASGALLFTTGMNSGQTTTVNYYDGLLRPTQVTLANGSVVSYHRDTPNFVATFQDVSPSGTSWSETTTDGFGRLIRANTLASSGWYVTDYCYDEAGLLKFQSVTYQGSGRFGPNGWVPLHCSGSGIAYHYDALGRITSTTTDDGTATTQYINRAIKTTDVNNVQKITQYDYLGRITSVCEITSQTSGGQAPIDCGMDIAGTGFVTNYIYDMANHKVTIDQGGQLRIFQTDASGRQILTTEPERGTTNYSYAYNSTGLVTTRTRPAANQTNPNIKTNTSTQYDAVGRIVSIGYDDGVTPNRTYFYDAVPGGQGWNGAVPSNTKGRLVTTSAGSGSTLARQMFSYNISGQVQTLWQCAFYYCNGDQYHTGQWFSYDLGGNLIIAGDYAAGEVAYTRSAAGEITSVTNQTYSDSSNPPSLISNVANGPFGPVSWLLGNGLYGINYYDSMGRKIGDFVCSGSNQPWCPNGTYADVVTYKGNRTVDLSDGRLPQSQHHDYDDLNRLTAVTSWTNYAGAPGSFTYSYDRWGNRTQQYSQQSQTAINLTYDTTNNRLIGYSYDAAGNLLSDGAAHSFTYDAEGNVLNVDSGSTASYVYDALNHRVRVNQQSGSFEYTYNPSGQMVMRVNASTGSGDEGRLYWDGRRLGYRSLDGGTYFTHSDYQGTERVRTNAQGQAVFTAKSFAFGDGLQRNPANAAADQDKGQFAGTEHDAESNTEHATFRQYSPVQGRWMSPDPYAGSYDSSNPQSFNRYAYVLNNPMSATDPDGEDGTGPSLCYLTASVCGGGYGGNVGGGGVGLAQLQMYYNSVYTTLTTSNGTVLLPGNQVAALSMNNGSTVVVDSSGNIFCGGSYCGNLSTGYLPGSFSSQSWGSGSTGSGSIGSSAPSNILTGAWNFEKRAIKCNLSSLKESGITVGLDAAGTFAGAIPGAGAALVATQIGLGVLSAANSASEGDIRAVLAGTVGGAQLSAVAAGTEIMGMTVGKTFGAAAARALPYIGSAVNAFFFYQDASKAVDANIACLAGSGG